VSGEFIGMLPINMSFWAKLESSLDEFDKGAFALGKLDKLEQNWEHLYTQLRTPTGSTLWCVWCIKKPKNTSTSTPG